MTLEVIPLIVSDEKQIIGIGPAPPVFERDLRKAMRVGLEEVKTSSVLITKAFGKMFSGGVSKGSFKNPVQIVNMGAATYRYGGLFDLARLTGQMSFNLFIFNLIPFLFIVDGGQITFLIIQAVRGKPLRQGVRAFLQNVGFFFLLALLLMTFL